MGGLQSLLPFYFTVAGERATEAFPTHPATPWRCLGSLVLVYRHLNASNYLPGLSSLCWENINHSISAGSLFLKPVNCHGNMEQWGQGPRVPAENAFFKRSHVAVLSKEQKLGRTDYAISPRPSSDTNDGGRRRTPSLIGFSQNQKKSKGRGARAGQWEEKHLC